MELSVSDDCLLFFVDDTGHELLKGQSTYGLGGCSVLARDLDRVVRMPWRGIRQRIAGSPDTPLHASEFARDYGNPENITIVSNFFIAQPFGRMGAIVTTDTDLHPELSCLETVVKVLQNRIVELAKWVPFDSVAIVIEQSDRADRLIERAFGSFGLSVDGKSIVVERAFMPKSGDPALEVADFIVHTVGRQARQSLTNRSVILPDFLAVFQAPDARRSSFVAVAKVEKNDTQRADQGAAN